MSPTSNPEAPATASYVQELQEVFTLYDLHYGNPADLVAFSRELSSSPEFADELASLVRSFIFRERGVLSPPQLVEIVAIAVAGTPLKQSAKQFEPELRNIFNFLTEVAHAPLVQPARDQPLRDRPLSEQAQSEQPAAEVAAPSPAVPLSPQHEPAAVHLAPSLPGPVPRTAVSANPGLLGNRAFWAASACLLLLIAAGASFLHSRSAPVHNPVVATAAPHNPLPQPVITPPAAIASKPTPDVQPVLPVPYPQSSTVQTSTSPAVISHSAQAHRHDSPAPRSQAKNDGHADIGPTRSTQASTNEQPSTNSSSSLPEIAAGPSEPPSAARSHPSSNATPPSSSTRSTSKSVHQGSFAVSSGVMAANLLSSPEPEYPHLASLTHVEGQVTLQAVIAKDGTVSIVHVLGGHRLLRGAAVKAVRKWRYRPYLVDGRPVDVATIVTLNFQIQNP